MSEAENKSLDVLGIKPVADAINTVTSATVDGAKAFLGRICLPAAEEFGLLLQDKVRRWRQNNAVAVVNKAQAHVANYPDYENRQAHPRIVAAVLEHASWSDDEQIQNMWAGLLATACTEEGDNQENLLFINLLSQLTPSETKILKYACETAQKTKSKGGWIGIEPKLMVPLSTIVDVAGKSDEQRLDLELDHLRELGILRIDGGFNWDSTEANISPSLLALQLYVKGQGFLGSALEYFNLDK